MALPTHRVSIFKRVGNEQWSNDWLLNVTDMDAAEATAEVLVEFERRMHHMHVFFEYFRVSTMTKGDRLFRHIAINENGYMDNTNKSFLPLFNTVRIDLSTLDSDPCRKYFRSPVAEDWQIDGQLQQQLLTDLDGLITQYFRNTIAIDNVVSNKGNVVGGATVYPFVQMRQLARRRKKKVT